MDKSSSGIHQLNIAILTLSSMDSVLKDVRPRFTICVLNLMEAFYHVNLIIILSVTSNPNLGMRFGTMNYASNLEKERIYLKSAWIA
jgi:hypothetical protein